MNSREGRAAPLAGVIFDLGGTLIYPTTTDEDGIRALTAWLRAQDWPEAAEAAVREARSWVLSETQATGRQVRMQDGIRRAAGRLGRPVGDAFVAAAEAVFFAPELAGYRPFDGAVRLLFRLQAAGLRLACISNATSHWLIERIVELMGFGPFLDPVVSSAAFGRTKPDPAIFRSVLDAWGLPPGRVAMVGDTLAADIAGARAAGLRSIHVTMAPNPDNPRHRHTVAEAEAGTLDEVAGILLGWRAGR